MQILTSFVGPHGAAAAAKVVGARTASVLPLNLKSDLLLSTATFGSQAKLNGWCSVLDRRVRDALHHPNKLRYAGCERPEQLEANPHLTVMLDDAGWLTRHLPLDINACEPFAAWQGSLKSYLAAVRLTFDALGIAIRRAIPMSGVRLLAAEVFDVTLHTATSGQPPHPSLRRSHIAWFAGLNPAAGDVLGPQWNPIYSVYNTRPIGESGHADAETMSQWVLYHLNSGVGVPWFAITPLREDDTPIDVELVGRDLRTCKDSLATGYFVDSGVVLWANPRSVESAGTAAGLCSEAIARATAKASTPEVDPSIK